MKADAGVLVLLVSHLNWYTATKHMDTFRRRGAAHMWMANGALKVIDCGRYGGIRCLVL